MIFDVGPKKVGKIPVLSDKKKPKEVETDQIKEDELMTFDAGPKKVGKKPELSSK